MTVKFTLPVKAGATPYEIEIDDTIPDGIYVMDNGSPRKFRVASPWAWFYGKAVRHKDYRFKMNIDTFNTLNQEMAFNTLNQEMALTFLL